MARGSDPAVQSNATLRYEGETILDIRSQPVSSSEPTYPDTLIVTALSNAHDHGRGLKTIAYGTADTAVEAWVPATYTIPALDPYAVSAAALAGVAAVTATCKLSAPTTG